MSRTERKYETAANDQPAIHAGSTPPAQCGCALRNASSGSVGSAPPVKKAPFLTRLRFSYTVALLEIAASELRARYVKNRARSGAVNAAYAGLSPTKSGHR